MVPFQKIQKVFLSACLWFFCFCFLVVYACISFWYTEIQTWAHILNLADVLYSYWRVHSFQMRLSWSQWKVEPLLKTAMKGRGRSEELLWADQLASGWALIRNTPRKLLGKWEGPPRKMFSPNFIWYIKSGCLKTSWRMKMPRTLDTSFLCLHLYFSWQQMSPDPHFPIASK